MNMKKKLVTVCLVACMAVTAVAGGTLAYFTDTKEVTNTFTVGNVEITLTEPNWKAEKAKIVPGVKIAKDPTVTLDSESEDAWVFMEVEVGAGLKSMMEATASADQKELKAQFEAWVAKGENSGVDANWKFVEEKDGKLVYSYKGEAMKPGKTEALFDKVVVPETLTNEMVEAVVGDMNIKLTAKAIQTIDGVTTAAEAYAKLTAAAQ